MGSGAVARVQVVPLDKVAPVPTRQPLPKESGRSAVHYTGDPSVDADRTVISCKALLWPVSPLVPN